MRIDNYSFGKIVIAGKTYSNDLIIFPFGIKENWRRKQGHLLQVEDLEDVFNYKPRKLIIGRGYLGVMKVDNKVIDKCNELGIELITEISSKACDIFNKEKSEDTVLAVHLTC
jgi:hypothetical protein